MAEGNWGNCKDCKYFGAHEALPADEDVGPCKQPELSKFELKVFGASGCNAYELRAELGEQPEQHVLV